MKLRFIATFIPVILLSVANLSCMSAYKKSVGGEGEKNFSRIYLTDFNTAWQSILDALKSNSLDVSNREGGFIQTKWTENTAEKNFTESFGAADSFLKAQYRLRVSAAKGFFNGKPSVKVSVQKEQLIQRDVLEGWTPVETDSIDENTLLYRIGRIITIRTQLSRVEEEKVKSAADAAMINAPAPQNSHSEP